MSQAELARDLGVSRQAINKLVKKGVIKVGRDNKIDAHAARKAIGASVHPTGKTVAALDAPEPSADPTISYHVAKTLREVTEAKIAQVRLAEMEARLIDRERAASATFTAFRMLRDSLMTVGRHLAHDLATEADARVIDRRITAAVRDALTLFYERTLPAALEQGAMADPEAAE